MSDEAPSISAPGPAERRPTTDQEWTIHSINIHGGFFERWCEQIARTTPGWSVKYSNYPVEWPPPNGPWRGKDGELDLRGDLLAGDNLLTFLFECKKHNPEFIDWVFFPRVNSSTTNAINVFGLEKVPRTVPVGAWDVNGSLRPLPMNVLVADQGRETRGVYSRGADRDKTKTANAAISDASHQIALATRAIAQEEINFSTELGNRPAQPLVQYRRHLIFPTIVTTARLFLCAFDAADVAASTGEIPWERATLTQVPFLVFQYPLPKRLQYSPGDLVSTLLTRNGLEMFTRMHVFVIHSENFPSFLAGVGGWGIQNLP